MTMVSHSIYLLAPGGQLVYTLFKMVAESKTGQPPRCFGFQWHLTDRCNLRCAHCYQDDFTSSHEQPIERLVHVADQIFNALGDHELSVNLTGGEPLLLPHIFDLIDHLAGYENLNELHIITNGTIVKDTTLAHIANRPAISGLRVSLEAPQAAANDAIRGPGNFARITGNLPRVIARTAKPVTLMLTLAKHNYSSIADSVMFARDIGLSGIIFERFVPLGMGRQLADQQLGKREWRQVVAQIIAACDCPVAVEALMPYTAFWVNTADPDAISLSGATCNLGPDSMALMPNGTVYPCRRLPVAVGTLPQDPFSEIRHRLRSWAPAPRYHRTTEGTLNECAWCRASAAYV